MLTVRNPVFLRARAHLYPEGMLLNLILRVSIFFNSFGSTSLMTAGATWSCGDHALDVARLSEEWAVPLLVGELEACGGMWL